MDLGVSFCSVTTKIHITSSALEHVIQGDLNLCPQTMISRIYTIMDSIISLEAGAALGIYKAIMPGPFHLLLWLQHFPLPARFFFFDMWNASPTPSLFLEAHHCNLWIQTNRIRIPHNKAK